MNQAQFLSVNTVRQRYCPPSTRTHDGDTSRPSSYLLPCTLFCCWTPHCNCRSYYGYVKTSLLNLIVSLTIGFLFFIKVAEHFKTVFTIIRLKNYTHIQIQIIHLKKMIITIFNVCDIFHFSKYFQHFKNVHSIFVTAVRHVLVFLL